MSDSAELQSGKDKDAVEITETTSGIKTEKFELKRDLKISGQIGERRKFFVTGVKDLSTGVKYMDSKVVFRFIHTGVKDLSTGVKYMDSKVDFWFYSYWGGGRQNV